MAQRKGNHIWKLCCVGPSVPRGSGGRGLVSRRSLCDRAPSKRAGEMYLARNLTLVSAQISDLVRPPCLDSFASPTIWVCCSFFSWQWAI